MTNMTNIYLLSMMNVIVAVLFVFFHLGLHAVHRKFPGLLISVPVSNSAAGCRVLHSLQRKYIIKYNMELFESNLFEII